MSEKDDLLKNGENLENMDDSRGEMPSDTKFGVNEESEVVTGVVDGVEKRTVENTMEEYFLRYSMSVIIDRALPDVRDGLKPVHRRILYAMNKKGWKAPNKTEKSAKIIRRRDWIKLGRNF